LERALQQLSQKQSTLFRARYEDNQPIGEIAAALGIKYGAAARRLGCLKERLRTLMEGRNRTP
jgi:DNA-directed RNA polymerase specialized sigma24 family protein